MYRKNNSEAYEINTLYVPSLGLFMTSPLGGSSSSSPGSFGDSLEGGAVAGGAGTAVI